MMIKVQTTMFTAIAALTVDMGEAKSLSCIRLYPFWADGRVYGFKVEGSGDGKNWKMLVDKTENSICAGSAGFTLTYPGPRLSLRGLLLRRDWVRRLSQVRPSSPER